MLIECNIYVGACSLKLNFFPFKTNITDSRGKTINRNNDGDVDNGNDGSNNSKHTKNCNNNTYINSYSFPFVRFVYNILINNEPLRQILVMNAEEKFIFKQRKQN